MTDTALIPTEPAPLAQGNLDPSPRWECVAAEWIKTRKSDRTRRTYAAILAAFFAQANRQPWEVTRGDVADYALSIEGKSDATRALHLAAISAFYKYAMAEDLITRNPAAGVPRPTVQPYGRAEYLTREQVTRVLAGVNRATVEGRRDYALLGLEMTTSVRRAELVSIRRGDLTETPQGDIVLAYRPKGGDEETRKLPKSAVIALRPYLEDRGPLAASDPVFVAHDRGAYKRQERPLTTEAWRCIVAKYTQAALGFSVAPHALRHSAATALWNDTRDLKQVQRLLGHKHALTTQRYIDHVEDDRAALGDRLAELFSMG